MFKFDYEYLSACAPYITCVVPEHWITENAPTLRGNVDYTTDFAPSISSSYMFTFAEGIAPDGVSCDISFDIKRKCDAQPVTYKTAIDGPIKIHCHNPSENDANSGAYIPIVLLNHLLGFIPGSIPAGMSWLDSDDVFSFLATRKELHFAFDAGNDHDKIISYLRQYSNGNDITASFPIMFVNSMVRLKSIEQMKEALEADLVYAPSVNGEQTLVSWLFECS